MLCHTNDFRRIVYSTEQSDNNRKSLYEAFCEKGSAEDVRKIYACFTSQEQKDLKLSFEKHGYDINYKPVESTGAARIGGLRENCDVRHKDRVTDNKSFPVIFSISYSVTFRLNCISE